jgi:hypothetical protein
MVGVSLLTVEGLLVAEEAVLAAFGNSSVSSVMELVAEASEHAEPGSVLGFGFPEQDYCGCCWGCHFG